VQLRDNVDREYWAREDVMAAVFLFHRVLFWRQEPMTEREITCGECGAPMGDGIIQSDGSIMFVCTRDFEHILFVTQNN
jgi:hypothetical protein